jgi:hypothetical protein
MSNFKPVGYEMMRLVPMTVVREVRSFISDYADTNELFEGEENSDTKIARYIKRAVDEFNGTPPVFREGLEPLALALPNLGPIRELIIKKAAVLILNSIMIKLARNDVPYTAGNVTIQRNSVWRNLQPLVQDLNTQFMQGVQNIKVSANISGGWGGVGGNAGIAASLGLPKGGSYKDMLTEYFAGTFPEMVDIDAAY